MQNSNLQSGITYPNGVIKTIDYEQKRDLITAISYQNQDKSLLSSYSYTNDVLGQRVNKEINYLGDIKNIHYGYNPRSEVISATDPTLKQAFDYDNIGNRIFAKNNDETTLYQTNNLNQYTSISSDSQKSSSSSSSFAPVFDTDGNQTTIKTSTGEWLVEYNVENRPIKFTQGNKTIEMSYYYMGRRVEYILSENDVVNQHAKFVYNDYVLVQELSNANILLKEFVWDPTAGQATIPLVFKLVQNNETFFYTQDANKNIAELVFSDTTKGVAAHYEYDAFGAIITTNSSLSISNTPAKNIASINPFRFSSEYHDSPLGLVYYNYRHYNPNDGRWLSRDPIAEKGGYNLYAVKINNMILFYDLLGLYFPSESLIGKITINEITKLTISIIIIACDQAIENAVTDMNNAFDSISKGAEQALQKTWNAPNTLVGFTVATTSVVSTSIYTSIANKKLTWTAEIIKHDNIIAVKGFPNTDPFTAISMGNISIHRDNFIYLSEDTIKHENGHTYQSELLGPLYFPAHIVSMACSIAIGYVKRGTIETHMYNSLDTIPGDDKNEPTEGDPFPKIPWIFKRSQS